MSVSDAEPVMLDKSAAFHSKLATTCIVPVCAGDIAQPRAASGRPTAGQSHLALNKVYQRKGVNISLDISPESALSVSRTILSR